MPPGRASSGSVRPCTRGGGSGGGSAPADSASAPRRNAGSPARSRASLYFAPRREHLLQLPGAHRLAGPVHQRHALGIGQQAACAPVLSPAGGAVGDGVLRVRDPLLAREVQELEAGPGGGRAGGAAGGRAGDRLPLAPLAQQVHDAAEAGAVVRRGRPPLGLWPLGRAGRCGEIAPRSPSVRSGVRSFGTATTPGLPQYTPQASSIGHL